MKLAGHRVWKSLRLSRNLVLSSAAALAAFGSSACVSLLPKAEPAQLYRFGQLEAGSGSPVVRGKTVGVTLAALTLPRAAAGDQILTLTGNQAAYIAGARWITPATQILQEDLERAFDVRARRVRLMGRGDIAASKASMRIDVDGFEAQYDGSAAPPIVLISVKATLFAIDGSVLDQTRFSAREPAATNRVTAIVQAFDLATKTVMGEAVSWVDAVAPAAS